MKWCLKGLTNPICMVWEDLTEEKIFELDLDR